MGGMVVWRLWKRLTTGHGPRGLVLVLASGGVLWLGSSFRDIPLPTAGDGVTEGFFTFLSALGAVEERGLADFLAAAAGLVFSIALLGGALYREVLALITDRPALPPGRWLFRAAFAAGPLGVFLYVGAQWLTVFTAGLLLLFSLILVISALRSARVPRRLGWRMGVPPPGRR
ncbi:hypothetical protein Daud_1842 [Candidatus Desulforudis audaxviator MP104C]|uniref:Uncharacterized protein n=1 Tax=Desulforudis audaxviator (strain MP104C) TaxID=477974 RepID=B1I5M2_DESAP|nr:hypothetical protein Daud_1842 [Candidatus Desulforudis audaxviator MP104C]AZK60388.1 hypothetical protein Daudx_1856 [Candidatus Desulforudis audaxviator]